MSVNLLLEHESDPCRVARAHHCGHCQAVLAGGHLEGCGFPVCGHAPGTGDVPLTVFQTLPVDGIVVVASPQELVSLIVAKAVNMAQYDEHSRAGPCGKHELCPVPGLRQKKIDVFGESHVAETAAEFGVPVLARIPIDPQLARQADLGVIEIL